MIAVDMEYARVSETKQDRSTMFFGMHKCLDLVFVMQDLPVHHVPNVSVPWAMIHSPPINKPKLNGLIFIPPTTPPSTTLSEAPFDSSTPTSMVKPGQQMQLMLCHTPDQEQPTWLRQLQML